MIPIIHPSKKIKMRLNNLDHLEYEEVAEDLGGARSISGRSLPLGFVTGRDGKKRAFKYDE